MGISEGTVEDHWYRGLPVRVWRTFEDFYGPKTRRRPIRRAWHFDADGLRSTADFATRESALLDACLSVDFKLDGYCCCLRGPRYTLNSDEYLADEARKETLPEADRDLKRRGRLMNVTVERGYSPAEEAFAKERLAKMGN